VICAFCDAPETKVIDSRLLQNGRAIRRRRVCESCNKRFTTYEEREIQMPIIVKRDGRRESYYREKVLGGFKKACQKRPISISKIESIIQVLEKNILEQGVREISSQEVGELAMKLLYDLDRVAFVRFAAIYWDFKDIDDFVRELRETPGKLFPRRRTK